MGHGQGYRTIVSLIHSHSCSSTLDEPRPGSHAASCLLQAAAPREAPGHPPSGGGARPRPRSRGSAGPTGLVLVRAAAIGGFDDRLVLGLVRSLVLVLGCSTIASTRRTFTAAASTSRRALLVKVFVSSRVLARRRCQGPPRARPQSRADGNLIMVPYGFTVSGFGFRVRRRSWAAPTLTSCSDADQLMNEQEAADFRLAKRLSRSPRRSARTPSSPSAHGKVCTTL